MCLSIVGTEGYLWAGNALSTVEAAFGERQPTGNVARFRCKRACPWLVHVFVHGQAGGLFMGCLWTGQAGAWRSQGAGLGVPRSSEAMSV